MPVPVFRYQGGAPIAAVPPRDHREPLAEGRRGRTGLRLRLQQPEDEKYGCMAHRYAMDSLSEQHRIWLQSLPDLALIETLQGRLLLCHGILLRWGSSPLSARKLTREAAGLSRARGRPLHHCPQFPCIVSGQLDPVRLGNLHLFRCFPGIGEEMLPKRLVPYGPNDKFCELGL